MISNLVHLLNAAPLLDPRLVTLLGIPRATFYSVLPDAFTRKEALLAGALAQMSPRNVSFAIADFITHGLLTKPSRAHYQKLPPLRSHPRQHLANRPVGESANRQIVLSFYRFIRFIRFIRFVCFSLILSFFGVVYGATFRVFRAFRVQ